ncbi:serine hydrolase domain-containing protein [Aquimarina brevivitae]|uniref:CubicO group peptidase (Beta-lactamase class C family) n=1 Tax=Aquimarina brevivitae TaxID=323412 RepID=A0A4Q7P2V6_9FLAO|nr:serine hydrolase [Aquimarina brevivitae]RZS93957.1 CubicO group peptidase (beta-lactamase class C family) [Aquimarina brevivitae]
MRFLFPLLPLCILLFGCSSSDETVTTTIPQEEMYFPSTANDNWDTVDIASLNWNEEELTGLFMHLETNNTRAFIVLKNGRIAIEKYWGNNIVNTAAFTRDSQWYWASAGKSLTATLVGIAQQEGLLAIGDKTSDYLGADWTSLSLAKENLITIKDQLQMTTGLDYEISDLDCTVPNCLTYRQDAGTQWYYHNAPYTLLEQVVSNAAGTDYNNYTDQKIESPIGMNGQWILSGYNNVYWSTARDMARFGLLIENEGNWDGIEVLNDQNYYTQMVSSSQELNPAYGYLWWLNGKNSIIFPSLPNSFPIPLTENAPDDLFAALGKNGQIIDIVPSQNLVVIRMGEAPDGSLVPIQFHDEMWQNLNRVITE